MPISKVWIYRLLLFVLFFFVFVRLQISLPRIKLEASNFAWWFIGVLGRESPILGTLLPQKPKIARMGCVARAGEPWHKKCGLAHGPHVGVACVDIQPTPKTDVLV